MNLEEVIEAHIRGLYESGKTQIEIAESCNVPQPYIHRLLSGKQNVGGITIRVFCKMFPNATVNLNGGTTITAGNIAIKNHGTVQQSVDSSTEKFSQLQTKVIMDDAIPAEYKVAFLKLIEEAK